jgi:hypothetical protein
MKCGKQNISQEERNNVNVVNVDTDSKPDQKVLFKDVIKCCYENITRFSRTKNLHFSECVHSNNGRVY